MARVRTGFPGLLAFVAALQQPKRANFAMFDETQTSVTTARIMFWLPRITTGRVFGFDMGDWSLLLSGVVLGGLIIVGFYLTAG